MSLAQHQLKSSINAQNGLVSLLVILMLSVCSAAYGLTLKPYSAEQLGSSSQVITYAQVIHKMSFWENKRIITRIRLHVINRYIHPRHEMNRYTPSLESKEVTLEILGGTLNGLSQIVHGTPRLNLGDRALFFMRCPPEGRGTCSLVGMGLGVWREYKSGWIPDLIRTTHQSDQHHESSHTLNSKSLWYSAPMTLSSLQELCQFKLANETPVDSTLLPNHSSRHPILSP